MTKLVCSFLGAAMSMNLLAQSTIPFDEWHATVTVIDEAGLPMPGAHVSISYFVAPPPGSPTQHVSESITGITGPDGTFSASHRDRSVSLSFGAEKEGFYQSYMVDQLGLPRKDDPVKWIPNITLTLKKIGHPIAMYAKLVESGPPAFNKPVGYDLTVGDWVSPFGKGLSTDIIFYQQVNQKAEGDFDSTLFVRFPNRGDGIQEFMVPDKPREGSALRSPHEAPTEGYQPEISRVLNRHPGQGTKMDMDPKRNYFLRVRTVLDASGNVTSAFYGKIYGDFMHFRYYLDPTPNDLNIEFDPAKNLLKSSRTISRQLPP
jgi:hypothetical protein